MNNLPGASYFLISINPDTLHIGHGQDFRSLNNHSMISSRYKVGWLFFSPQNIDLLATRCTPPTSVSLSFQDLEPIMKQVYMIEGIAMDEEPNYIPNIASGITKLNNQVVQRFDNSQAFKLLGQAGSSSCGFAYDGASANLQPPQILPGPSPLFEFKKDSTVVNPLFQQNTFATYFLPPPTQPSFGTPF